MAHTIQIRNVPDEIHLILRAQAAEAGLSLSEFLRNELQNLAGKQASLNKVLSRLRTRAAVDLSESAAEAIQASRKNHDQKW